MDTANKRENHITRLWVGAYKLCAKQLEESSALEMIFVEQWMIDKTYHSACHTIWIGEQLFHNSLFLGIGEFRACRYLFCFPFHSLHNLEPKNKMLSHIALPTMFAPTSLKNWGLLWLRMILSNKSCSRKCSVCSLRILMITLAKKPTISIVGWKHLMIFLILNISDYGIGGNATDRFAEVWTCP